MMNLSMKTPGSRRSCFNAGIHNYDRELDLVPSPDMNFFVALSQVTTMFLNLLLAYYLYIN